MAEPARLPPGEKGTDCRVEADDGYYWVRLVTRGALDREGACMGHCVGDGDYDQYCGAEDLSDSAIWSLRRPDGVSALTVQIVADQVDTVKGYRNHPSGRGAALQFRHLVAEWKAAGKALVAWSGSKIVIAPDGRTFRSDRVPPDVQAALDEAERARRASMPAPSDVPLQAFEVVGVENGMFVWGFPTIRSHENPMRPILEPVAVTAGVDLCHHAGRLSDGSPQSVFHELANLPNPLVSIERSECSPHITYRLRDGQEFTVTRAEIWRVRAGTPAWAQPLFLNALLREKAAAFQPGAVSDNIPASWKETEVRIAASGTSGYPGGGGGGAGVATGSLGATLSGGVGEYHGSGGGAGRPGGGMAGGHPGGGGGGAGRPRSGGAGRLVFRILNDGSLA